MSKTIVSGTLVLFLTGMIGFNTGSEAVGKVDDHQMQQRYDRQRDRMSEEQMHNNRSSKRMTSDDVYEKFYRNHRDEVNWRHGNKRMHSCWEKN